MALRALHRFAVPIPSAPVRWLVHGNLSEAVAAALVRHGDQAQLPAAIELAPDAAPADVFAAANATQLDIVTNDPTLAGALFESEAKFSRSLVFLQLAGADVEQDDAIDRLFARYKRLVPGRMYTV